MPKIKSAVKPPVSTPSLDEADRKLSALDVAEMVGLSVSTLRDYRSTRGLQYGPPFHKNGRRVFYRLSEVLAWIDSRASSHGGH